MTEFSRVIHALIAGKFICQYSDNDYYQFLLKENNAEEINQYLQRMDLSLSSLNDNQAYYCSYLKPQAHKDELKEQFKQTIEALKPLVSFLRLIQQVLNDDDIIRAGDLLRLSEIQSRIEDSPLLEKQLTKLVSYSLFKSSSSDTAGKLKQLFKRLVDLDYLSQSNPARPFYMATYKWMLLIEQLSYINEREKLELESRVDIAQSDLL